MESFLCGYFECNHSKQPLRIDLEKHARYGICRLQSPHWQLMVKKKPVQSTFFMNSWRRISPGLSKFIYFTPFTTENMNTVRHCWEAVKGHQTNLLEKWGKTVLSPSIADTWNNLPEKVISLCLVWILITYRFITSKCWLISVIVVFKSFAVQGPSRKQHFFSLSFFSPKAISWRLGPLHFVKCQIGQLRGNEKNKQFTI